MNSKNENIKRLNEWKSFERGWNGYVAEPIPLLLINKAIEVISNIINQPFIYPTGRDSIQFEYEKENGDYLEFELFLTHVEMYKEIPDVHEKTFTYEEIKWNELINEFLNL